MLRPNVIETFTHDGPDRRPFQSDTAHVSSDEINNGGTVQLRTLGVNLVDVHGQISRDQTLADEMVQLLAMVADLSLFGQCGLLTEPKQGITRGGQGVGVGLGDARTLTLHGLTVNLGVADIWQGISLNPLGD
ncbi:hypothetical protein WICPIJ_005881 [Wickerhamomyces pijperi]|uniref:Uncharacterized protein n=1 Tax=Wickerhamomyces pijperi TaxID=599730 RepID=A0A9P8Q348_WICPI|nr:hypothetical protein WICPIJ_005881 [Wickerhamomyces pijperi]